MKKGRIVLSLMTIFMAMFLLFCLSCTPTESLPEQGITILSPKADDVVQAGAPYEIQWKAEVPDSEFGANVTIEFSKDGGKSWEKVEENVPTLGNIHGRFPKWIRHSVRYVLVPNIGQNIERVQKYSL